MKEQVNLLGAEALQPWKTVNADEDPSDAFRAKTAKHIELVNKYAAHIGKTYPDHDRDKLEQLFEGYKYLCVDRKEITHEQQMELNRATAVHITTASHHQEYWDRNFNAEVFDRRIPDFNVNATAMSENAIDEMLADWCAQSEICGSDPFTWLNDTCSSSADDYRWIFTEKQIEYMKHTLDRMWNLSDPKKVWRLESSSPDNGLWYDSHGNYVWGCRNCKGETKNLPMDYDRRYHVNGLNWFSSCSDRKDLAHWYSYEDAVELHEKYGFVFTEYLVTDYIVYPTNETVFLKETALNRREIPIDEFFGRK